MALAVQTPRYNGFTLIELLVVISIIGVLSALLVANFVGVRERAADTNRKNDLTQLKKALRLYYNDYQGYPVGSGSLEGCGDAGDTPCSLGGVFEAGTGDTVYMKELPEEFEYHSSNDERFVLLVELDNASDEDITASQTRCSSEISAENVTVTAADFIVCQD